MWKDPIIEEIRKTREEYASRFNYDLDAIYKDLKRSEKESGRKTVTFRPRPAQKIDKIGCEAEKPDSSVGD
ncbi:MAG: hypothetical protein H7833_17445 [Magnetococcus sp. DMHC-1]|nr:hypothetical protein [Magnetococcales bacterium]